MSTGRPPAGRELDPAGRQPVFADLSGRRRRQMRLAGLVAGGLLVAWLAVMTIGLLGGPRAPVVPWAMLRGTSGSGKPGTGAGSGAAAAARIPAQPSAGTVPAPSAGVPASGAGRSAAGHGSSPSGQASASPTASASPSPVTTNPAGRVPPGRNGTPSPHASPTRHASAA